ncbi:hypothetical protein C8R45DRAFT_1208200 [Mycena sanguinolenta]|nr:hypothetical protein C8R45DRAFT_1208200 [Mycena sanguinolenta]
MSSPRIAFHFLLGNMPLSNGISGIPDLDDALFGPMSCNFSTVDASIDPALDAAHDARPSYAWDQSESVESIFDDLHEFCARRAPSHPLALPERPFYPFDPAEVADTRDVVMSEDLHTASQLPAASLEVEQSDDSSEDSDSDSDDDDMIGPDSYCDRVDAIRPHSPGIPQSSPASPSRYVTRASSSASASSPTRATASTASRPASKRRATVKRPKARRAFKPRANATSSLSLPFSSLTLADASVPNLLPPPGSRNVPRAYWYLLRLGCVVSGRGLECYKCRHITGNCPDMTRHVVIHNRAESEVKCSGCPQSFARSDALQRHVDARGGSHCGPARREFLKTFEKRPDVLKERAGCNYNDCAQVTQMNKKLNALFERDFSEKNKHKTKKNKA